MEQPCHSIVCAFLSLALYAHIVLVLKDTANLQALNAGCA